MYNPIFHQFVDHLKFIPEPKTFEIRIGVAVEILSSRTTQKASDLDIEGNIRKSA